MADHWERLLPSDADVRFYRENGYWLAPRLLAAEEIASLREHHAAVVAGEYETTRPPWSRDPAVGEPIDRIVKIDNSYWADTVMARLALHPAIGAMAARLTGAAAIRLWHDQLLLKPPDSGTHGNVGWHQDYHYWQCAAPSELLTAWVALDDVDERNGCMHVVPGSHTWGLLEGGDFFDKDLAGLRERMERSSGHTIEPVPCHLPAGAMSFHHCLTIHGSGPNLSAGPRRSLVVHMLPEGTCYRAGTRADGHMNVTLLHGHDGEPFAGPYFPVLYRAPSGDNAWRVGV